MITDRDSNASCGTHTGQVCEDRWRRPAEPSTSCSAHLFGVVVHHAGRVVHSQADLVLSLAGLRPPHPDLVLAELTRDVGNDLSHVETLSGAVVPSVGGGAQTHGELTGRRSA